MEIWKEIPESLINIKNYFASNFGNIQNNNIILKPFKSLKNNEYYYKAYKIKDKTYYCHRLVFFAFNLDIIPTDGRVMYKNYDRIEDIVDGHFYRSFLEDLIFIKYTNKIVEVKNIDNEIIKKHTEYNLEYYIGRLYPVKCYIKKDNDIKQLEEFNNYELYLLHEENQDIIPIVITNKNKINVIKINRSQTGIDPVISLSKNSKKYSLQMTHVILSSIFPEIIPNDTVDHIDNNHKNHIVSNLMWKSRPDNSSKNQQLAKFKNGKKVEMWNNSTFEELNFNSVGEAAIYVLEVLMKGTVKKTVEGKIRRSIKSDGHLNAYGCKFTEIIIDDLDDETWIDFISGDFTYKVSDKGRFKNLQNIISCGSKLRGKKYRNVSLVVTKNEDNSYNSKKYYMHRLVYEAFNGIIPDKIHILHNDKAPLNEDGTYRNWLIDLRLGEGSENMKEYYQNKKNSN
jgi:hypothetical protein